MLKESAKVYMKNLKIIYLFNILLLIFTIFYVKNYHYVSKYQKENEVVGVITKITKKDDNVRIIIDAKEKLLLNCYSCSFDYEIGDIVKFKGEFKEIKGSTNFNLFDYKKYLSSIKIFNNFIFNQTEYVGKSNNIIYKAYNILNNKINNFKSNYFIKAMILGDTSEFAESDYANYKENGIVHLFAISGMHVGIISSLLIFLLKKIFKFDKVAYFIIYPILIFYMILINSASIIRSVLMFIISTLFKTLNIKISSLNIIYVLFMISLIDNPYSIYNMGFMLTYVIAFFLIIGTKKKLKIDNYFFKLFYLSMISFLASFPILINSNFEFNLLTPIINIFIIPFVSIIMFPLAILTLIFPFLDEILNTLLVGFNYLNEFLSSKAIMINVCHLNIYLIIIYYLILISFFLKSKHIYLLMIYLIFLINLKNINFNSYLIMIDVGQGDSILVKNYFGENILIDAGAKTNSATNIIIPYLKSIGVTRIDRFIISHGDQDHIIGAKEIIENFNVKNIYLNSYKNSNYEQELIDKYEINFVKGNVFLNNHIYLINIYSSNENDDSIVTYLIDYKVLMMGDASSKVEAKIDLENINILKVGHHGSNTSSSKEFVDRIKPKMSLISVGLNNKYNHPNKETIENLKNSLILMTSVNGMIKVNLSTLKYQTMF
mgnify:CR=1 FL=1